ncbi:hypothetical protein H4R19_004574, partial [Coemansia spiralis]
SCASGQSTRSCSTRRCPWPASPRSFVWWSRTGASTQRQPSSPTTARRASRSGSSASAFQATSARQCSRPRHSSPTSWRPSCARRHSRTWRRSADRRAWCLLLSSACRRRARCGRRSPASRSTSLRHGAAGWPCRSRPGRALRTMRSTSASPGCCGRWSRACAWCAPRLSSASPPTGRLTAAARVASAETQWPRARAICACLRLAVGQKQCGCGARTRPPPCRAGRASPSTRRYRLSGAWACRRPTVRSSTTFPPGQSVCRTSSSLLQQLRTRQARSTPSGCRPESTCFRAAAVQMPTSPATRTSPRTSSSLLASTGCRSARRQSDAYRLCRPAPGKASAACGRTSNRRRTH